MTRSYAWVSAPGMILILAGVMKPYIQPYWDISMIWLAAFCLIGMLILGFVERYLGFFSEDASYNTERNSLLVGKLKTLEDKIDKLEHRLFNEENGEQRSGDNSSIQDDKR